MADQARPPPPVGLPCEAAGSGEFVGNAAAKQDAGQPDAKRMRTMGEAGASPATAAVPQTVGEREETSAGADRALHTEQVGAPTPWPASPKKPPGDASAPVQKKGASAKRPRTNAAAQGMLPGFALPGAFVPAQFAPGMIPWLGVMHQAPAGSSKTSQPLQHQQMVMWQQDQARAMAFWQQQQQKQEKGPKSKSAGIQAKLTKARKLFSRDSRDSPKQQESLVHPSTAGIPAFTSAKGQQQHSTHAVAVMQQSGIGAGDGAAAHAGSMDGMGAESQLPMHDTKLRRIWDKFDEASEDMEKMEAFILEVLADQPTILAAAVDAESGQSIRHATVMRAVCEARPMLNLLVGVLSKYVPVDAWNREVRPMCEQLQSIFGKPGLFCGHAQGAKELKAAELVRNPPENASQRKGRDGRTPKGEGEGFVSMYGKRLVQSCRCDSSKCLKMYCTCFRNGARCNSACVCMECYNDGLHEEERMAAARVYASQIKKPRVESSKLQQQAALLAATQESKKKDKERKRRGRAYTRSQIKAASKFVREYEKKTPNHGAGGEGDAPRCHDIPRTGTFENEETWAAFCALTGEVNHRAINLWDRVQRDMKKAGSAISPAKHMPTNASGAPSAYPQPPAPPVSPPPLPWERKRDRNKCVAGGEAALL